MNECPRFHQNKIPFHRSCVPTNHQLPNIVIGSYYHSHGNPVSMIKLSEIMNPFNECPNTLLITPLNGLMTSFSSSHVTYDSISFLDTSNRSTYYAHWASALDILSYHRAQKFYSLVLSHTLLDLSESIIRREGSISILSI